MLTGSQIRRRFLDYFIQKGHREVHSSSLVPQNDPTLLFTNAGMNQFKDVFLGLEKRDYTRATSSQKCVRAGGKHNDLENVGFTNRHHTFFEMLGNFSFGDYYKEEAIGFAWELLTSPQWFNLPLGRLYVTIFGGARMEPNNEIGLDFLARQSWEKVGVPTERIIPFSGEKGLKENFWQMGDTGPCGPCSEIHYDMGPAASDQGHTDCAFGCDCGRYVEIWNLVFMQFDRDASGKLNPLPKPSIDTGMGLERIAAVLQGVISNYETDLFVPLIKKAAELTGVSLKNELDKEAHANSAASLRVIADHSRAATFLISDGVLPSNEGRGYVLRKIIRRAITHGRLLGETSTFLHEMVDGVREVMQDAYPELNDTADHVKKTILAEETRFAHTLEVGNEKLEAEISAAWADTAEKIKPAIEQASARWRELARQIEEAGTSPAFQEARKTWLEVSKRIDEALRSPSFQEAQSRWAEFAKSLDTELTPTRLSWMKLTQEVTPVVRQIQSQWANAFSALKFPATSFASQPEYTAFVEELKKISMPPILAGEKAFKLYDTFGLPPDFMQDVARDQGVKLDEAGFEAAMKAQRELARASWRGGSRSTANPVLVNAEPTEFVGYRTTRSINCKILYVLQNGTSGQGAKPGEEAEIILDRTPFYADSGGQVGDTGWFLGSDHSTVVAEVRGCYFPVPRVRAHRVTSKGLLIPGGYVDAVVNTDIRQSTMRNHTATHLLHAGLREVLGKHVKQAGSLVAPNHLRFDFSHFTSVEDEELQDIEDIINKEVLRNEKVEVIENVPIDVAVNEYHAMALFGEKYGDKVRVIKIGDFSTELCGGTHTLATGEIGLIKILKEGSVSSGVRRIEAVTGEGSLQHFRKDHKLEGVVASLTSKEADSPADALRAELDRRDAEIKRLARELDQARIKSASSSVASASDNIREVCGVKVLAHRVDNLERPQLRTLVDQLRDKLGSGVVVVGSASNGSVSLIAGVTKDLTSRIQAGKVVGAVAEKVGGKGGGRPDLAEAGGKNPEALDSALAEVYKVVESLLG